MKKQESLLVIALTIIKFLFPFFLVDTVFQPNKEEFLHFNQGSHLAFGYLENQPLIAWLAYLLQFFESNFFILKFFPALFGAFTYFFVGRIIIMLGGKYYAIFLAFLPFIFSAFLPLHFSFSPAFLQVFFVTLMAFCVVKYSIEKKATWLYIWGITVGLGLLSSENFGLFALAMVIGLALSRERYVFLNYHFYIASLIAVLIFSPNLYWQIENKQALINNISLINNETLVLNASSFFEIQVLFLLGGIFIWIIGLMYILLTKKGRQFLVFFWMYFFITGALFLLNKKGIETVAIYPVLIAFGAYSIERLTSRYVKILRYVLITPLFYVGFLTMPILMPFLSPANLASLYEERQVKNYGLLKWNDGSTHAITQEFAERLGWKEVVEKAAHSFHNLNESDKQQTIIYCKDYGFAGAFNFYRKQYNLPEAINNQGSFLKWMPTKYDIKNIILIDYKMPEKEDELFKHYETKYLADEFKENEYSAIKGTKIMLFLKAKEGANAIMESEVNNLKSMINF